ncbi:hypothetical protein [Kribbella solani]|uniref:hypothetical protein n=1 Tax=Kribbella solani TaxID=236067 RepID=UPI0029BA2854|nr:hypothetical protein [Kribbella solani]MDX2968775.1 hypothetical protein [Kribbella solani]
MRKLTAADYLLSLAASWRHGSVQPTAVAIPPELMAKYRTPGAFGGGIEVYGAEVVVPPDAPLQDRLLGLLGREP